MLGPEVEASEKDLADAVGYLEAVIYVLIDSCHWIGNVVG
jgi:hypothetical protein